MNIASEMEIVERLVSFSIETKYKDIPEHVLEFTKGVIIKTIAGMVVGSTKPSGKKMAALIKNRRLPQDAGVIACGFKTSLWEAVFLNAFLAHASEIADNYTVVPLLLSLVETHKISGKSLIEAVAIGLEIHSRACFFQNKQMGLAFVSGSVAPAMAAGKVFRLNKKEMTSALAIATPNIGGTYQNMGTDAHYFESALFTLQGIVAAEMAREGMTGNPQMISFLSSLLGKENVSTERITLGLGSNWLLCQHWIKKYPCCFQIHRFIDALLELKKEQKITYDEVDTIIVDIGPSEAICDCAEPMTEMDLQFSFQHILGVALVDHDVIISHLEMGTLHDTKLTEARKKVRVIVHPEWSRDDVGAQRSAAAHLKIIRKDGKQFSKERLNPIGCWPETPLSVEQVCELYTKLCQGILPDEVIKRTGNVLAKLENFKDLKELMEMLVFEPVT